MNPHTLFFNLMHLASINYHIDPFINIFISATLRKTTKAEGLAIQYLTLNSSKPNSNHRFK